MKVELYNQNGEKTGTVELNAEVFAVEFNKDLVHQAHTRQLANARLALAHTKTRHFVNRSTKKPFKQKGTGNARQGSTKSAQMRGGGIIFGPSNEKNYKQDMPKKQRRKALFCTLSEKARNEQILALENYPADVKKTKNFAELIQKLPIQRNVLVVMPEHNEGLELSAKNLPSVKTILVNYLNIADLIKYDKVLFLKEAFSKLEELFLKK